MYTVYTLHTYVTFNSVYILDPYKVEGTHHSAAGSQNRASLLSPRNAESEIDLSVRLYENLSKSSPKLGVFPEFKHEAKFEDKH